MEMTTVVEPISSCHARLTERSPTECSIVVTGEETDCTSANYIKSEEINERIEEFQRTAEDRKKEFERLLEEHAQVILRLKQIENTKSDKSTAV